MIQSGLSAYVKLFQNADRRVDAALFCHEPNHDSSDRRNSNVVQSIEPNSSKCLCSCIWMTSVNVME